MACQVHSMSLVKRDNSPLTVAVSTVGSLNREASPSSRMASLLAALPTAVGLRNWDKAFGCATVDSKKLL